MEYLQLIDQAIHLLKPVAAAGGGIGSKVAASALWDWLKEKFKPRSAATAEAVAEVEKSPDQEVNWTVLKAQLAKVLAGDESLRKELAALVAQHSPTTNQTMNVTGHFNKSAQTSGDGNFTQIS